MNKTEAIAELKRINDISTTMLDALGISFEGFLMFAQLPDDIRKRNIKRLIEHYEKGE